MLNSVTQHFQRNRNLKALWSQGTGWALGLQGGRQAACRRGWTPTVASLGVSGGIDAAGQTRVFSWKCCWQWGWNGRESWQSSIPERERELLMYSSSLILLSKVSCGQQGQVLLCRGRNYDKMYTQHQTCSIAWVSSCLLFLGYLSYVFVLPSSFFHSQSSSPLKRTERISKTAVTVMRGFQSWDILDGTIIIILIFIVFIYIV